MIYFEKFELVLFGFVVCCYSVKNELKKLVWDFFLECNNGVDDNESGLKFGKIDKIGYIVCWSWWRLMENLLVRYKKIMIFCNGCVFNY